MTEAFHRAWMNNRTFEKGGVTYTITEGATVVIEGRVRHVVRFKDAQNKGFVMPEEEFFDKVKDFDVYLNKKEKVKKK